MTDQRPAIKRARPVGQGERYLGNQIPRDRPTGDLLGILLEGFGQEVWYDRFWLAHNPIPDYASAASGLRSLPKHGQKVRRHRHAIHKARGLRRHIMAGQSRRWQNFILDSAEYATS